MRPTQLLETLEFAIKNRFPVLIKGAPGTGKTAICTQACAETDTDIIISRPVVSDPTDYKGLPFPNKDGTAAKFLPFGDLLALVKADKPTVFFLDDLGQAPMSVQASCMQLLLARRINGHIISDQVTFLAATNRRQDKAAVQGILEPVKSRFASIVELEVNIDDWVGWAIDHKMPPELIAFIRFRPNLLHDFKPTSDIINTPNPRTVAYVGYMMNKGIPLEMKAEIVGGAAGEGFAAEFLSFLSICESLPDVDKIIDKPDESEIPSKPDLLYAICGALSHRAHKKNFANIIKYTERLPGEFQVLLIRDAIRKSKSLANSSVFSSWAIKHSDIFI